MGYEWSEDELRTDRSTHKVQCHELLLLHQKQQPWGIFLLEFKEPKVFETKGFTTPLRTVLRGLVSSRRKDSNLRSWQLDNILFICTCDYKRYVFGHFRDTFGTGKVSEARLATFGWKHGEPSRTVITDNLPHLVWPEEPEDHKVWLKEWTRAFDKEPLTKKFFKQFDTVLQVVKKDLERLGKMSSADAYSKAQLLLERLIFLYFVQNRGWLNQNRGFLRENFKAYAAKPKECTYYSDFLEKLFWALSSPGGGAFARMDGVPFLNGGLFNDDEFEPSPRRKRQNPPLPIRNSTFALVFDELLEAFNFTVREDTPLNQEVAVDPEMLGKVFESIVLHAESADPDATAPDKRKQTGSYYTPRIVVHFICREVLFQYLNPRLGSHCEERSDAAISGWSTRLRRLLELDASDGLSKEELEQLKEILTPEQGTRLLELVTPLRCCDPAVGSGAFMVGLLHELTNLRRLAQAAANGYIDPTRQQGTRWLQDTKADIIQNCLFGVDIQQQAIEICMLRLWLSLVIDYDLGVDPFETGSKQFQKALKDISQLPNLEMNFKRGDSLHDHICGVPLRGFSGRATVYRRDIDRILALGEKLHSETKSLKKLKWRLDILRRRIALARHMIKHEKQRIRSESPEEFAGMGQGKKGKALADAELGRLDEALAGLDADEAKVVAFERQLEPQRDKEGKPIQSYRRHTFLRHDILLDLRKLEGATLGSDLNFAWRIDFPQVFYPEQPKTTLNGKLALGNELKGQMDLPAEDTRSGGFDIIVGNPPFVTARDKKKRELWRERWHPFCFKKYHLLVPFFPLARDILRPGGQLGYIVSNAFATRDFGRPLVELLLPAVDLQKVMDCSGLMFPGHGTPTCLVFARNSKPPAQTPVRVVATLPGGGDLRTPPVESPLWRLLEQHHERAGYEDETLVVHDRPRKEMSTHPWVMVAGLQSTVAELTSEVSVRDLVDSTGVCFFTNAEDIFLFVSDFARRLDLSRDLIEFCTTGEDIRNWCMGGSCYVLRPYDHKWRPVDLGKWPAERRYLTWYRKPLGTRATFSGKTYDEDGKLWYGYHIINDQKLVDTHILPFSFIATHNHFFVAADRRLYRRPAPIIVVSKQKTAFSSVAMCGLLNSSAALFWLKQVCFSKRESERPERDTYFEFAGGKVEQLPVPNKVAEALRGEWNPLAERLADLAQACWERGQALPRLAMKKLFEKPGEAYHKWNSSLPGYEKSHKAIGMPFENAEGLRLAYERVVAERERLRSEMVVLQEEMDWLVYAAYGLLPEDHPAVGPVPSPSTGEGKGEGAPEPLGKDERPFVFWKKAEGDFAGAVKLIPAKWSEARKKLWRERLAAIRDNEHIRRIEQPVYKRRWDEQWKVKGRWECGPVAYEAELRAAFEWWLLEKAEWYLEHKKDGGPVELSDWASALWKDSRIRAATESVALPSANPAGFERLLKDVVNKETVPDGIPFAKPWDKLPKSKYPGVAKARKIRGKLNVPRERFHLVDRDTYKWAGLLFR